MALPPGFLDELRNRLSISDVVGRKVVWDSRKSNQAKGDWWAPCPFHQEKTASFHVDDRKGYYYCFGCQAKGDVFRFVMDTENTSFMETVEILAGEAGLQMPAPDPKVRAQQDRRTVLVEAMERAVRHYRLKLQSGAGADARAYLARRGLDGPALDRWEIGVAPPGWDGLREALTGTGVALDALLEAGLLKASDKGRAPYDTFRDRVMFPIRDPRGRAIAFGGRAMDPKDNAKYLNSPETPLFDKGRTLYNHGPARTAVGKGQPLVVAEGYMDVIALAEAGFGGAVAPLGTAITEHQLRLLWRMSDEPIVALDGDAAGLRAAGRLIDLALPLIEAGQSLRFAILPDGKDPDDLLRADGPDAMRSLLERAEPMVSLLWRRSTEGRVLDSPERRAALDRDLRAVVGKIKDPSLRSHYGAEIKRRREVLFGWGTQPTAHRARASGFRDRAARWTPAPTAMPTTRASAFASGAEDTVALREAVVLATLLQAPSLIESCAHVLEERHFVGPDHALVAAALLACDPHAAPDAIRAEVTKHTGAPAIDRLLASNHVRLAPSVRSPGDVARAKLCLAEELAKLAALSGTQSEVDEAAALLAEMEVHEESDDDPITQRLKAAADAQRSAHRVAEADSAETEIAANGMRLDKDERQSYQALLNQIDFSKPSRRP